MNAGAGLLQNSGIGISPALTASISAYTSIEAISLITYCLDNADKVSGTTQDNLYNLGAGVFPGLTNIVLPADQAVVGKGALTSKLTEHANSLLGADVGVFAQHLSLASSFTASSNEFISSASNADSTLEINTDVNNLLTGAITDTTVALPSFAKDLLNSGNLLNYNDLRNIGNPLSFIKLYQQQAGGLPVIDDYLREQGINPSGLVNAVLLSDPSAIVNSQVKDLTAEGLVNYEDGVNPSDIATTDGKKGLGQAVWDTLGLITGDDLANVQNVLGSSIPYLKTAQDLLDPRKVFTESYKGLKSFNNDGVTVLIYPEGKTVDTDTDIFYEEAGFNPELQGLGQSLYLAVPEYIADSNRALGRSLQQVKDIFNITSQQLSAVAEKLETTKGLDAVIELEKPVPDSTIDYFKNVYGTGSGTNGQFLVTDVLGSVAGYTHTTELTQLAETVGALDDLGALDNLANLYETMKNLFDDAAGYYTIVPVVPPTVPPTYTETWYIPAGRYGVSAGSFGSRNAAVDVVIAAIDVELASLAATYPDQAASTTVNMTNISAQIKREIDNMPKAGIVTDDTQLGIKTAVMGLVNNLHDYGADESLGGTGWILENVAEDNFYGESLIAALREGRNLRRLNNASIGNSLFIDSQTRTQQRATLKDSTYSVDEAKDL